nr:hypothetical protein [Candidatus Aminicenantes bacterium]NIM82675.1 hypothetical protein [Candidatus Aminicenantes bacterium]NIN22048.1 hypothetical protein [Candidatus Aminicenantes bacterium]NIN45805.1 hypothetical protein [Candidatus Aminicenantes bacterium]NIN88643.1 hypothetical protein [Candidatus Aminicenantes bacterium]
QNPILYHSTPLCALHPAPCPLHNAVDLKKRLKFEARNSKFETNPNDQNSNDQNEKNLKALYHAVFVLDFEHLNFEFVSDFDIRFSDFLKPTALCSLLCSCSNVANQQHVC